MVKISKYYKEKKRLNIYLDNIFNQSRQNRTEINIKKLIYDLTKNFEVSEKAILERINLMQELYSDFEIVDNEILWLETNEVKI